MVAAEPPSSITTVWLARHGEVYNPTQVLYGRLPRMGLSVAGRRQAEALADFFAPRPLAAIYSSPMLRARKTAATVAARHPGQRVRIDRDLNEVHTRWQGRSRAELDAIGWNLFLEPLGPGDESMADIRDRLRRWLARMVRRHGGAEVLGVGHGDPLLILLADLRGLPLELAHVRAQGPNPSLYLPTVSVARIRVAADGGLHDLALLVPPYDDPHVF